MDITELRNVVNREDMTYDLLQIIWKKLSPYYKLSDRQFNRMVGEIVKMKFKAKPQVFRCLLYGRDETYIYFIEGNSIVPVRHDYVYSVEV